MRILYSSTMYRNEQNTLGVTKNWYKETLRALRKSYILSALGPYFANWTIISLPSTSFPTQVDTSRELQIGKIINLSTGQAPMKMF